MMSTATASHWKLARRYGKLPFRSPVNDVLAEMLSTVFSEEEAELAATFPVLPVTAESISHGARCEGERALSLLDAMDSLEPGHGQQHLFFVTEETLQILDPPFYLPADNFSGEWVKNSSLSPDFPAVRAFDDEVVLPFQGKRLFGVHLNKCDLFNC